MKSLLIIASMLVTAAVYAEPVRFICEDGNETEFMVLDENSVQFRGETFINMMPVDESMDYRGYSFINDPWMSLTVTTNMLKEEDGYADLLIENLQTGETESKGYSCIVAE